MKLQLRKMEAGFCAGGLVLTDEAGEILPNQITTHVVSDGDFAKLIVEFAMVGDGITLSDQAPKE